MRNSEEDIVCISNSKPMKLNIINNFEWMFWIFFLIFHDSFRVHYLQKISNKYKMYNLSSIITKKSLIHFFVSSSFSSSSIRYFSFFIRLFFIFLLFFFCDCFIIKYRTMLCYRNKRIHICIISYCLCITLL